VWRVYQTSERPVNNRRRPVNNRKIPVNNRKDLYIIRKERPVNSQTRPVNKPATPVSLAQKRPRKTRRWLTCKYNQKRPMNTPAKLQHRWLSPRPRGDSQRAFSRTGKAESKYWSQYSTCSKAASGRLPTALRVRRLGVPRDGTYARQSSRDTRPGATKASHNTTSEAPKNRAARIASRKHKSEKKKQHWRKTLWALPTRASLEL
jgi:hypothetical protein